MKTKLGVGLKPEREVQLISSADKISSPVQRSPSKHCGPDSVFFWLRARFLIESCEHMLIKPRTAVPIRIRSDIIKPGKGEHNTGGALI